MNVDHKSISNEFEQSYLMEITRILPIVLHFVLYVPLLTYGPFQWFRNRIDSLSRKPNFSLLSSFHENTVSIVSVTLVPRIITPGPIICDHYLTKS